MFFKKKKLTDAFPTSKIAIQQLTEYFLDVDNGAIINGEGALAFQKILKQRYNITAVASYLDDLIIHGHCKVIVWLDNSKESRELLKNKEWLQLTCGEQLYSNIMECLLEAVRPYSEKLYEKLEEFYTKQKNLVIGTWPLEVQLIDFEKKYLSWLFGSTGKEINDRLQQAFPNYRFDYVPFSIGEQYFCKYPLILFFTPDDLKATEGTNTIEQMTEIIKQVVSKADTMGLYNPDDFPPQVWVRRDLTSFYTKNIDGWIYLMNHGYI